MAGTFLCIGLSFVVVAVIILSTIGYHKIYVETVWATEIEEDLPEEETEYTMDLKEYTAKRIGTNLAVTKLKQNIKKGEELDVVQPLNAKTRLETNEDKALFNLPPSSVANTILNIMNTKKPKPRYYVTTATYILGFLKRVLSTSIMDRLLNKI